MREIDLDDVHGAVLDERPDVLERVRALAGRDWRLRRGSNARERRGVFGRHRFFNPLGIMRFQGDATLRQHPA